MYFLSFSSCLANLQEFHFEEQRRIGRDHAAGAARAVAELGRDGELALAADLHACDALVPALDHVALAERKHERLAAVLARVELAAFRAVVEEPPGVVHGDLAARLGRIAGAGG